MCDRALFVVTERRAKMILRLLVAAAKEARHFEVPAAKRTIRGARHERRIELQDGLEFLLDRLAILESGAQTERFGERPHIGCDPEMPFGPIRLQGDSL